jgi:hypothetical protein
MAKHTSARTPYTPPKPTSHRVEGSVHTWEFDGNITINVTDIRSDGPGRLLGYTKASVDSEIVNEMTINFLNHRDRIDFKAIAATRDGRVDWQDYLLSLIEPVKHVLAGHGNDLDAGEGGFVSFVSSTSGDSKNFPAPRPLPDKLAPVEPFEPALLPETFRPWIEDITERMQCPPDFPAVASMISTAAVVGRRIGIRPKRRDDWLVVPNLWGAVIGRSGVLKTPAIQEPLRPLSRLEFDAGRAYEQTVEAWKADQLIAKEQEKVTSAEIRDALKGKMDRKAKELASELLHEAESQPARQRYIVNDATVEKLGELLNQNPRGLLLFRYELTGFMRTLDREGHEGDRAFYLEAWNGNGRFTYDRISRGTIDIEAACMSILGGFQPGPMAHYLRDVLKGGAGDDGLMQRFQLLVWPDISSEWCNVDRWPDSSAKQRAYHVFTRLDQLTAGDVNAECDESLGGIPFLRFTDDAQEAFTEWRTLLEHRLRRGTEHPAMESHLAKYRSLVPSLALLIHLVDGGRGPVTLEAFERAAAWGEYLESHARRVYRQGLASAYVAARALADHLLRHDLPPEFTLRDVYRPQWSGLDTVDAALEAVGVLLDLDWISESTSTTGDRSPTGGRPSPKYIVNPRIWETSDDVA